MEEVCEQTVKLNSVSRSIRMSIPMPIVRALGLRPGDEVTVQMNGDEIIVKKEKK